jgi:hypothetical protein
MGTYRGMLWHQMSIKQIYIDWKLEVLGCGCHRRITRRPAAYLSFGVKQSLYRCGQAQRVPGVWGSQISRQSPHESGEVVSQAAWKDYVKLWKIPLTPSGIEPATFRLVAQCLNHLRHRVPHLAAPKYSMRFRSIISQMSDISRLEH